MHITIGKLVIGESTTVNQPCKLKFLPASGDSSRKFSSHSAEAAHQSIHHSTYLLREAPEDLFPDDLRREEALRLVRHDVGAEQRGSFRDVLLELACELKKYYRKTGRVEMG